MRLYFKANFCNQNTAEDLWLVGRLFNASVMAMAPPIGDAFQKAIAKFSVRLSKKESESFKFSTLDDVRAAMKEIQEEQGRQNNMMNLTRLKGFLEAMEQYGKVIDVFVNSSPVLCFVWGPIKFLLQESRFTLWGNAC